MLCISEALRFKAARYSKEEWYEIQKHPIFGLHLLERLRGMPRRISFVAYQLHERENGSGYPKQRRGNLIHPYAKMVMVADVFEALSSPRTHRPPLIPYDAMLKVVQMSKAGLFNNETVKALLEYVSVYPVGSLVALSNGSIGKVVHANKHAVQRPVVSILLDSRGPRISRNDIYQIDLSKTDEVKIARPLPSDFLGAIAVMDGF
jgi:HD-GYP domain-containing protein (c-di-GMP phosphodiesterase class II)